MDELIKGLLMLDDDCNVDDMDEALLSRYGVDMEQFENIVALLLPLIVETDKFRGFGKDGIFLIKGN